MMKQLLLAALLALAGSPLAYGQGVEPALPIDSVSQKVTFAGVVAAPGATAEELFGRAKTYAVGGVAPPLIEDAQKSVVSVWEKQITSGGTTRTLRYQARVTAKDGRYRYELTDLQNKTSGVQYRNPASGLLTTVPGGQAPIERVLANPDGYRKGKPTAALLSYQSAVRAAANEGAADLQRAMKGAGKGSAW